MRKHGKLLGAVTALTVGASVIAGCGSGNDQASGSNGGPSGTPLKIMNITRLTSPGPGAAVDTLPQTDAAAKAAAATINKAGGIGGRPIQIITCDDQSAPNQAATCGRRAVQEGVIAVTSSSLLAASYVPSLQAANIPLVGNQVVAAPDYTSPISFPLVPSQASIWAAGAVALIKAGQKNVGIANFDSPLADVAINATTKAIQQAGGTFAGRVAIPATASEYTGYIQQLKDKGVNGVVLMEPTGPTLGLVRAASQIGYKPMFFAVGGRLTPEQESQLGPLLPGAISANGYPLSFDPKFPGLQTFLAEMAAEKASGDSAAATTDDTALNEWLAVHAIAEALKGTTGTIDAKTVLAKLREVKSMDLYGILNWTPNTPGPADQPRVTNGRVFITNWQPDGKLVPSALSSIDMYAQ